MKHRWDLLLVVTNDRYGSELFGTVQRLIDTALHSGHSIQVWACGNCNMLTDDVSNAGPVNDTASCCANDQPCTADCCSNDQSCTSACCADLQPATTQRIGDLLAQHPDRFSWVACSTCSNDRGASQHIAGALTEPGFANFREYVDNAAKTVYIGGA